MVRYDAGSAVCMTFRKNCPRKGFVESSWLVQVSLMDLHLPLLGLIRSSTRHEKSHLIFLKGMVFAWVLGCTFTLMPLGLRWLSKWMAVKNAVCPSFALSVERVPSSGTYVVSKLSWYISIYVVFILS